MWVVERIRESAFIKWWNKWYSQKKVHRAFPVFTALLGVVIGMLISPQIGAICLILAVYLGMVIFIPWNHIFGKIGKSQLKFLLSYLTPAIVVIAIAIPTFDNIVSIFPSPASKQELANLEEQTASLARQRLTIHAWGTILTKVKNRNYDPKYNPRDPFIFDICCPFVPPELYSEKSLIAVNYKFYETYPLHIDSRQLSIGGKTLIAPTPSFFADIDPDYKSYTGLFFMYFKYEGIIKPGSYDNVTLTVIAENTTPTLNPFSETFISDPFSITIPEPQNIGQNGK